MANQFHIFNKAPLMVLFFLLYFTLNIPAQGVITNGTKTIVKENTYFISDNDFTIESGGELSIEGFVTVNGTLGNTAGVDGIKFFSNSTRTGSLIFNAGTPPATVERFSTDGQWHLITSPVDGADANQIFFDHDPKVWLKEYNESSNDWAFITDLNTDLLVGKGFVYWVSAARQDVVINYEGDLHSGDLMLSSSSTPPINYTDVEHGFNLIGNPFASAIDWDDDSWVYNDIEETVWVWEDEGSGDGSGNYLFRNKNNMGNLTDGIIPYGQGFFIRATDVSASITIPAAGRTHSIQGFYKSGKGSSELDMQYLVLDVKGGNKEDQVWIAFNEDATEDFDNGWDVSKFFRDEEVPQLFLDESYKELSIDVLPPLNGEPKSVAMGFIPAGATDVQITATVINRFDDTDIILEDKKTGVLHDLHANNTYQFIAETNDDPLRFVVHFNPVYTQLENNLADKDKSVKIFSGNKSIIIKDGHFANGFEKVWIRVYSINGREIKSLKTVSSPLYSIPVNVDNSYLLVSYQSQNGVVNEKVFIK